MTCTIFSDVPVIVPDVAAIHLDITAVAVVSLDITAVVAIHLNITAVAPVPPPQVYSQNKI